MPRRLAARKPKSCGGELALHVRVYWGTGWPGRTVKRSNLTPDDQRRTGVEGQKHCRPRFANWGSPGCATGRVSTGPQRPIRYRRAGAPDLIPRPSGGDRDHCSGLVLLCSFSLIARWSVGRSGISDIHASLESYSELVSLLALDAVKTERSQSECRGSLWRRIVSSDDFDSLQRWWRRPSSRYRWPIFSMRARSLDSITLERLITFGGSALVEAGPFCPGPIAIEADSELFIPAPVPDRSETLPLLRLDRSGHPLRASATGVSVEAQAGDAEHRGLSNSVCDPAIGGAQWNISSP